MAEQIVEPELDINIYPRGYDRWEGTRAQLEAEGVVPVGCEWPQRNEMRIWDEGGFQYLLQRRRPEGFKGPMKAWLGLDNFMVRRSLTCDNGDGFTKAHIYEKAIALADALWHQTPPARHQWSRYCEAQEDARFQALMVVLAAPPKPARKKAVA